MGTTHANTPYDALIRLETLSMMGETNVPVAAIRRQIASAIHIVVQIQRMNDGSRKVTCVSEILPEVDEHGRYQTNDIFTFTPKERAQDGRILGEFAPTGQLPSFMREIEIQKLPFGRERFKAA